MSNKFRKLQLEALDKKIKKIRFQAKPKNGWARTIRLSLMLPLQISAKKISISPQAVFQLEKGEVDETISLKSLRRLAESINCELHYAIIPHQKSLKKMIEKRAIMKAKSIVKEVEKTMSLENQKVKNSKKSVKILTAELIENLNSKLWEI
jgi:predicted DNA-binding mobile mystery protein A